MGFKGHVVLDKKVSKWLFKLEIHVIFYSVKEDEIILCCVQVLCDEYPFYNFQIPHKWLVQCVRGRKVTEEITIDATMTNDSHYVD